MPVFNNENYIKATIDSVLSQTFIDFEFLIINDGSQDKSVEIIESYSDPRIRLVHNDKNMNLVPTLNRGIELAKGEYIARIDADDIARPTRLEKQVALMDANPSVGLCGTWIELFDGASGIQEYATEHEEIKVNLLFTNSLAHPTVMIRKSMFVENNLQYKVFLSEDWDLWYRASFVLEIRNIPEVLLDYRISAGSYTQVFSAKTAPVHIEMIKERLARLGIEINDADASIFRSGSWKIPFKTDQELKVFGRCLNQIITSNAKLKIYNSQYLNKLIIDLWRVACNNVEMRNLKRAKIYLTELNLIYVLTKIGTYKFLYKLFLK